MLLRNIALYVPPLWLHNLTTGSATAPGAEERFSIVNLNSLTQLTGQVTGHRAGGGTVESIHCEPYSAV